MTWRKPKYTQKLKLPKQIKYYYKVRIKYEKISSGNGKNLE